jgi:hypothetical protein
VVTTLAAVITPLTLFPELLASQQRLPDAPVLRMIEDVRINSTREQLVNFSTVRIGPKGEILLNQNQDGFLLLFDSAGRRVRSIGRRGGGPGEFSSRISSFGWVGDSVWAFERERLRITMLAATGQHVRNIDVAQIPASATHRTPPLRVYLCHAVIANSVVVEGSAAIEQSESDRRTFRSPSLVLLGMDATVRRVVAPVKTPPEMLVRVNGNLSSLLPPPFPSPAIRAVAADGRRIGTVETFTRSGSTGYFRLLVTGIGGDTLLSRQYDFTGEAIPGGLMDSVIEARARQISNAGQRSEYVQFARRESMSIYPPVRELLIGRDESYWLLVRSSDTRRHWLAVDRVGSPIGTLILSQNQNLEVAESGRIWISESDSNGLRHLVRFALR